MLVDRVLAIAVIDIKTSERRTVVSWDPISDAENLQVERPSSLLVVRRCFSIQIDGLLFHITR